MLPFENGFTASFNYSQMRSLSGNELTGSQVGNGHSLPNITQPILSRYRNPRPCSPLLIEESSSLWCSIFGSGREGKSALCPC